MFCNERTASEKEFIKIPVDVLSLKLSATTNFFIGFKSNKWINFAWLAIILDAGCLYLNKSSIFVFISWDSNILLSRGQRSGVHACYLLEATPHSNIVKMNTTNEHPRKCVPRC